MLEIIKKPIRKIVVILVRFTSSRPWIRKKAMLMVNKYPYLKYRIRSLIVKNDLDHSRKAESEEAQFLHKNDLSFSSNLLALHDKTGLGYENKSPLEKYLGDRSI